VPLWGGENRLGKDPLWRGVSPLIYTGELNPKTSPTTHSQHRWGYTHPKNITAPALILWCREGRLVHSLQDSGSSLSDLHESSRASTESDIRHSARQLDWSTLGPQVPSSISCKGVLVKRRGPLCKPGAQEQISPNIPDISRNSGVISGATAPEATASWKPSYTCLSPTSSTPGRSVQPGSLLSAGPSRAL
jgi:hypothetical protein